MIDLLKNRKKFLLSIIALAFILRIICIIMFGNITNPEMWEFGILARNLLTGNGYSYPYFGTNVVSAYMPPALGYIYFIFFYLFGDNSTSYIMILLLNSVISAFNVLIIFRISEIIYNINIAALSALYYCFSLYFSFQQ